MRTVLTSCFQEFNILSKRSFSVVLAAFFVYTCDILKISSFLFVHMWFEEGNHYFYVCSFRVLMTQKRFRSKGSNLDYSWSMHVWKSWFDWMGYANTHSKSEVSESSLIWWIVSQLKIKSSFVWYNDKAY